MAGSNQLHVSKALFLTMVSAQRERSYRGKETEGCVGVRNNRLGGGGEDRGKGSLGRPGFYSKRRSRHRVKMYRSRGRNSGRI